MLKKLFIGSFILLIILAVICQQNYLSNLKKQYAELSQKPVENVKLLLSEGEDFKIFFYDNNGVLKGSLSGKKMRYYTDATFTADGGLIYQGIKDGVPTVVIQTESGIGEFDDSEGKNKFLFSGNGPLKSLKLPEIVTFDFNGNKGTAKNIFIDALKRTISSDEHIHITGPNGDISANGFFYDIETKEIKFNSNIQGIYKQTKPHQH